MQLASEQPRRRPIHRVTVTGAEMLTPHMRRMAFEGAAIADMSVALPAQWLKVVVSDAAEIRPENRAYTIRHFCPEQRTLQIDFVLHGDTGPASAWAQRADIGDVVHLGSPRGGFRIDPGARWRLLAGDETALPAIASILDALPPDDVPTHVIVETPSRDDAQVLRGSIATTFRWLARDDGPWSPGQMLEREVTGLPLSSDAGQVFLAGEATAVRRIRQDLGRRAPSATIDAKGYWMLGRADHRDES